MKKFLFLFLLPIAQSLSAQVISWSNYSQFTQELFPARIANSSSFPSGLLTSIGNGISWDASGLTPDGTKPNLFLGYYPSAKSAFGNLYTNTQWVRLDTNYLSLVGQDFFQLNADSMTLAGYYNPASGMHEIYTNPMKMLVFPMNFNQSVVDDYAKTNYSNATTISSYQTGTNTISFVGYGTLKLPQGSFSNVSMVSMVRTNSLGPNSLDMSWYDNNTGLILLNYHSNNGSTTVVYNTRIPSATGIPEAIPTRLLSVLNNGNGPLSIHNNGTKACSFTLYNSLGERLEQSRIEPGESVSVLQTERPGVYYMEEATGLVYRLVK